MLVIDLARFDAFLFDLDGVINKGQRRPTGATLSLATRGRYPSDSA